jgi:hypothetical protein
VSPTQIADAAVVLAVQFNYQVAADGADVESQSTPDMTRPEADAAVAANAADYVRPLRRQGERGTGGKLVSNQALNETAQYVGGPTP